MPSIYDFFKESDFDCKCDRKNCDAKPMDTKTLQMLYDLRVEYGKPMTINSARRCKYWNEKQGGSEDSYHMNGCAIDISVKNGYHRGDIIVLALKHGFMGIGVPSGKFVHLDTRAIGPCFFGY